MNEALPLLNRRHALQSAACGFGWLALRGLVAGVDNPLSPRQPHFAPRAKRVIFLFMRGGPSQVDSFDYKPRLSRRHGEQLGSGRQYFQSPWQFTQHGQCGLPVSSLFPNLAKHADDLCVLNSCQTDIGNHPQAILQMLTGSFRFVRPSVGAWVTYGLGTENQNLPGFITITPDFSAGGAQKHGAAFLPAACAGTVIGNGGVGDGKGAQPLKDFKLPFTRPSGQPVGSQRRRLDLLQSLNEERLVADRVNDPLESIIQSYELAYRMQSELPAMIQTQSATAAEKKLYGIDDPDHQEADNFGRACLMARRFAEAGVRFIQLNHGFWDHHRDLEKGMTQHCLETERSIAGLLTDLKQRGLLDDTLVLWGGEFGRPPILNKNLGRDHNAAGFTMWMAGGGVRGGLRYGSTDETGQTATENKAHLYDIHATLLHLIGLDHERLTYRYGGRDFRLTDVHGHVIKNIIS